jgi:hypothetical protein
MEYSIKTNKDALSDLKEVFQPMKIHHGEEAEQFLAEYVITDMNKEGLDPLNKDDVKEFWRRRGIES